MSTLTNWGDSLIGDRISSQSRKVIRRNPRNKGFFNSTCFVTNLEINVFCVIEKPLVKDITTKRSNTYKRIRDALKAERIIVESGKPPKCKLFQYTGSHRGNRCIFKDTVFCVIDLPMEPVRS